MSDKKQELTEEQWQQIETIMEDVMDRQTKRVSLKEARSAIVDAWDRIVKSEDKLPGSPLVVLAPSQWSGQLASAVISESINADRLVFYENESLDVMSHVVTVAINEAMTRTGFAISDFTYAELPDAPESKRKDEFVKVFLGPLQEWRADVQSRNAAMSKQPRYIPVWWNAWEAYYAAARMLGIEYDEKDYDLLTRWCKSCPSVFPYEDLVVVGDNPIELHYQGDVLHNEDGPAVLWADGFAIYMIEGVPLDEQIVMRPDTQTVDQMLTEPNEEVKRIRIDRYGWLKLLEETGAKVIDRSDNDLENTKELLCELGDMRVLICHCPSQAKVFALEVEPTIETCEAAQNYLHTGSRIDDMLGKPTRVIGRS